MKKFSLILFFISFVLTISFTGSVFAVETAQIETKSTINITPPRPCNKAASAVHCPTDLVGEIRNYSCATNYEQFLTSPETLHYWVEDPQITALGQGNERARQFLYWSLSRAAIDEKPVLKQIWQFSSYIAYFFVVLAAAIFGIGFIVSKRTNFQLNIKVWPTVFKIGGMLLYIAFSASIVILFIQLSEIMMQFFIANLGGKDLFNIYFANSGNAGGTVGSSEANYTRFFGCSDLNIRVQESIQAETFLLKATNITYYIMGVMIILRKILLWFLLFISPFLAILFPFVLIRNIGWVWVGVFFQWLFYGPLFALFLGAMNQIWKSGIPFQFDFSRSNEPAGYIYPTALNITFGGPAQVISGRTINALNSGNHVDTFVEYVITLIMLWAVIFFPWWLLRLFRDYCCDGIYAMKNILLAMYDQSRGGGSQNGPKPSPSMNMPSMKLETKIPKEVEIKANIKLQNMNDIRQTKTEQITKTLNLQATKLTDIARMETNKETSSMVKRNLDYLSNPIKAQTPNERQQFMNIRTELFSRAVKNDADARTLLGATSSSRAELMRQRETMIKSTPQLNSLSQSIGRINNMTEQQVHTITDSFMQALSKQTSAIEKIAQTTKVPAQQVQQVFNTYSQYMSQPITRVLTQVSEKTNIDRDKVRMILQMSNAMTQQSSIIEDTATKEQVKNEQVTQALKAVANNTQAAEHNATPQPLARTIATEINTTEEKAQTIAQTTLTNLAQNEATTQTIQEQTGVEQKQVQQVLTTYAQNISQPSNVISEKMTQTGVKKENVEAVMKSVTANVESSQQIVQAVAQQSGVKSTDVASVIAAQIPLATEADKHIEQSIAIPPTVSIEDYEEVKEMWTKHYEEGEIPMTENVQTREEWVEQDIVLMTNTLNKLISEDANIKQQGFDELGFILPIFTINNLKGEELLVYLKAKLEAAKLVQKIIRRESKLRADIEKEKFNSEENMEFVELKKKKEDENTMTMEMEQPLPEEPKTMTNEAAQMPLSAMTQPPENELPVNPLTENMSPDAPPIEDISNPLTEAIAPPKPLESLDETPSDDPLQQIKNRLDKQWSE